MAWRGGGGRGVGRSTERAAESRRGASFSSSHSEGCDNFINIVNSFAV